MRLTIEVDEQVWRGLRRVAEDERDPGRRASIGRLASRFVVEGVTARAKSQNDRGAPERGKRK